MLSKPAIINSPAATTQSLFISVLRKTHLSESAAKGISPFHQPNWNDESGTPQTNPGVGRIPDPMAPPTMTAIPKTEAENAQQAPFWRYGRAGRCRRHPCAGL